MDAVCRNFQQLLAAADVDSDALRDRLSGLFDDVAPFVVPWLPLDARARAACARKAWRTEAAAPALWAELDFKRCAVQVTDAKLAALCARAGPALRSLHLDTRACFHVSGHGLVAALRAGGCTGLRCLGPPRLGGYRDWTIKLTPALSAQLVATCPQLERAECEVVCATVAEAAQVACSPLPGPLKLSVEFDKASKRAAGVMEALLLRSVSLELILCKLTRTKVVALAESLRANSTLKSLCLSEACVDDVGAAAIADALRMNSTLESLELDCNNIGDVGAAAFGDALRVNNTLTELLLSDNCISAAGMTVLGEMLLVNDKLKCLDLMGNNVGRKEAAAFEDKLYACPELQNKLINWRLRVSI